MAGSITRRLNSPYGLIFIFPVPVYRVYRLFQFFVKLIL